VPWHNKIVVGTTDTLKKHSLEPIALETEIEFVLETAQRFLAKNHASRCPFCLCRAKTISSAKEPGKSTKEVSRSHKIIVSDTGLITITGGKWTTYRKIMKTL
jgi:glycerol-3-phosphate dehydrogenase